MTEKRVKRIKFKKKKKKRNYNVLNRVIIDNEDGADNKIFVIRRKSLKRFSIFNVSRFTINEFYDKKLSFFLISLQFDRFADNYHR